MSDLGPAQEKVEAAETKSDSGSLDVSDTIHFYTRTKYDDKRFLADCGELYAVNRPVKSVLGL